MLGLRGPRGERYERPRIGPLRCGPGATRKRGQLRGRTRAGSLRDLRWHGRARRRTDRLRHRHLDHRASGRGTQGSAGGRGARPVTCRRPGSRVGRRAAPGLPRHLQPSRLGPWPRRYGLHRNRGADRGGKAAMAHVGDTRLYIVRSGKAHQLSADHTLAADMVRQGLLAVDHVRGHPQSHVLTRVLGPQPLVDVETLAFDVHPGDRLVVCSDGLADYIPSDAWLAEEVSSTSLEELPDELVDFANANGGHDNSTVIVIGVEGSASGESVPARSPRMVLDVMGSSFLFADLSLAQLSRLVDRCDARIHDAGDVICSVGDNHDELILVVSGTVRITDPDGRTALAGPGQHIGENFVLRPRRTRAKIVVEQTANILALDQASLVDLASQRPWLGVALLTRLVQRMSSDLDRLTATEQPIMKVPSDLL